jgi:hypothetical protein
MSRTSDEELGRRRFQLGKEEAVEDALEKIRRAQAVDWPSLCAADCMLLQEILGELWICVEREKWEQYSFSRLTRQDILDLLTLGAGMRGGTLTCLTLEEMDAILSHTRNTPSAP